jgi:hypothetical protein
LRYLEERCAALKDLVETALELKAGLIPKFTQERFMGCPGLVTDELSGMTIADYIAAAKGIFEFVRFDENKPGILAKLGSITNDAVGGLIAGCSSNMYSQSLRGSK